MRTFQLAILAAVCLGWAVDNAKSTEIENTDIRSLLDNNLKCVDLSDLKGEYLVCWSESAPYDGGPKIIYGRTRDFKTVVPDPRGYANWPAGDGLISPWREGQHLYLFVGQNLHVMTLPVSK